MNIVRKSSKLFFGIYSSSNVHFGPKIIETFRLITRKRDETFVKYSISIRSSKVFIFYSEMVHKIKDSVGLLFNSDW